MVISNCHLSGRRAA